MPSIPGSPLPPGREVGTGAGIRAGMPFAYGRRPSGVEEPRVGTGVEPE